MSYPPSNNTENAILLVTDIYGIATKESKLLADSMAATGYLVVMPDIFAGDIPAEGKPLDFLSWVSHFYSTNCFGTSFHHTLFDIKS